MQRTSLIAMLCFLVGAPAVASAEIPGQPGRGIATPRDARMRIVAPQHRITSRYARRLVVDKLARRTGTRAWSVSPLSIGPATPRPPFGTNLRFQAVPKQVGSVLTFDAVVNPVKGRGAPRGLDRVTLIPHGCFPPLRPLSSPR